MAGSNQRYVAKQNTTAGLVLSGTAAGVFVTQADSTKPCILYFPTVVAKSAMFCVRAWGRVTTGTSGTFLATIQYGTSATAASNTDMCALAAQTVATNGNWSIATELQWDTTSQKLRGSMWGVSGDTPTLLALAVNTAVISTVDLTVTGGSGVGLVMSAKFGTGNAANTTFLDGFEMEIL